MAEIDLEALADGYRHRRVSPESVERASVAATAARLATGCTAIDVGGGRGSLAAVFAERGARSVVVDRSHGMAAVAGAVPGVQAIVGDSARLPLADSRADLVFFHLSIHYGDWTRALDEAARVCRPGGAVWIWTFGSAYLRGSFLAEWFPSVGPIDAARFPPPGSIAEYLVGCGFEGVAVGHAFERAERSAGEWREAVEAGFVSTLQMLPPGELESGLRRFVAAHPDPDEMLSYELRYESVSGFGPSLR